VFIYKNRRMKPLEIVLRREGGGRGKAMEEVNLSYTVSTFANITAYPLYNYCMQ
jgi:hypothetical protein